jgi:hypothetical protein
MAGRYGKAFIIHMAFKDILATMLRGNNVGHGIFYGPCSRLKVLVKDGQERHPGRETLANRQGTTERTNQLDIDESTVEKLARILFDKPWSECQAPDLATTPSSLIFILTCMRNWVGEKMRAQGTSVTFIPNHLGRQLVGLSCGC